MSRSVNRDAQRFNRKSVTLLATMVCLLATAGTFGARALHSRTVAPPLEAQPVTPVADIPGLSIDHLVPEGMPVVVSKLSLISQPVISPITKRNLRSPIQLKAQLQHQGQERLTGVNLMLFEFDAKGALQMVDGWVRNPNLTAAPAAEMTLDLRRGIPPGSKLMLAVERINSDLTTRDAVFKDLARASNAKAAGKTFAAPPTRRSQRPLPNDSGADLCANAFRRAMTLAQDGNKSGITSFTCNQQDRSFRFSFNGKVLLP